MTSKRNLVMKASKRILATKVDNKEKSTIKATNEGQVIAKNLAIKLIKKNNGDRTTVRNTLMKVKVSKRKKIDNED